MSDGANEQNGVAGMNWAGWARRNLTPDQRPPNYDWRVQVRVTGVRNGWNTTLVDTPTFELRSNPQFGGIWTIHGATFAARDMFARIASPGDEIHVTVSALIGSEYNAQSFTVGG